MRGCCAAASDSSSKLWECSTILRYCAGLFFPECLQRSLMVKHKSERQFHNLLFRVLYTRTKCRFENLTSSPSALSPISEALYCIRNYSSAASKGFQLPWSLITAGIYGITTRLCHCAVKSDPTHARSRPPDCPVTGCLPRCSNTIFTIVDIPVFTFLYVVLSFCTLTVRAHTAAVVCICGDIFKQPAKDIQPVVNTGSKVECRCSIFAVCLQELSLRSSGQRGQWWMETVWGSDRFSFLIEMQPGVQTYQIIAPKPIFSKHFTSLGQWQKFGQKKCSCRYSTSLKNSQILCILFWSVSYFESLCNNEVLHVL